MRALVRHDHDIAEAEVEIEPESLILHAVGEDFVGFARREVLEQQRTPLGQARRAHAVRILIQSDDMTPALGEEAVDVLRLMLRWHALALLHC